MADILAFLTYGVLAFLLLPTKLGRHCRSHLLAGLWCVRAGGRVHEMRDGDVGSGGVEWGEISIYVLDIVT